VNVKQKVENFMEDLSFGKEETEQSTERSTERSSTTTPSNPRSSRTFNDGVWSHDDLGDDDSSSSTDDELTNGEVINKEMLYFNLLTNIKQNMVKVFMIGDSGVGKTSLLRAFIKHTFSSDYKLAFGVDFNTKKVQVDGKDIIFQIWYTTGREDLFQSSLGTDLFTGFHGCILVFDHTNMDSFLSLNRRKDEFLKKVTPLNPLEFPFVVIGNKNDEKNMVVTSETATTWCKSNGIVSFYSTSAKTNEKVEEAFTAIAYAAHQYSVKYRKTPLKYHLEVDL